MEILVGWVSGLVRRQSWRRGLALGLPLFMVAFAVRLALGELLTGRPFLLFVPVVLLTVLIGGGWAGSVLAVLTGLVGWFWFIEPELSFAPPRLSDALAMLFGWLVLGVTVVLVTALSRSLREQTEAQAEATRQAEARRIMFHELQHRVANNLQFVSALLGLAAGRVNDAEDGRAALSDAQHRLQQMARLHRWLHDPAAAQRDLGGLLASICAQLQDATGATEAGFDLAVEPLALGPDSLTAVALIVNEAVTNALKHAARPGQPLRVRVGLRAIGDTLELLVQDNGPGLPTELERGRQGSLGLRVMEALAGQLGGRLELDNDQGALVRVRFPATAGKAALPL